MTYSHSIMLWHINLILGAAGAASGTNTGAFVGMAACGASVDVLCIPALLGGVYGGDD